MKFDELLERLNQSSIKDIAKKIKVYNRNLDKKELIAEINNKMPIKKKKWYSGVSLALLLTIVGLILTIGGLVFTITTNQHNNEVQENRHKVEIRYYKNQIDEIKKLSDIALKKYDLLREIFPDGYIIYTQLSDGESATIPYAGKWIMEPEFIQLELKPDGQWYISYVFDGAFTGKYESGLYKNVSFHNYPIDINQYTEPQFIKSIKFRGLSPAILMLRGEGQRPKFAIGLTDYLPYKDK